MAITVGDLEYQAQQPKKVKIFNPDFDDFTVNYDGKEYTLHAQEIEVFDAVIADHIKKHLAYKLMGLSGITIPTDEDWQKIYKKIEVDYYDQ